jgi:hypothetical protein
MVWPVSDEEKKEERQGRGAQISVDSVELFLNSSSESNDHSDLETVERRRPARMDDTLLDFGSAEFLQLREQQCAVWTGMHRCYECAGSSKTWPLPLMQCDGSTLERTANGRPYLERRCMCQDHALVSPLRIWSHAIGSLAIRFIAFYRTTCPNGQSRHELRFSHHGRWRVICDEFYNGLCC